MQFLLSEEQSSVRDLVTPFLKAELKPEKIRQEMKAAEKDGSLPATDRELWRKFSDLGLLGGLLPERLGGLGLGLLSAASLLEAVSPPINTLPIFQTLANALLPLSLLCDDGDLNKPLVQELLASLLSGEKLASGLSLSEGEGFEFQAEQGTATISGQFLPFLGGEDLDLVFLTIERESRTELYVIEKSKQAEGNFEIESLQTLDLLRPYSSLIVSEAQASFLGVIPSSPLLSSLELAQAVLAAAELCGLGASALALTLDYVKTREQFGRPIGSFQALQHSMADMHLACEQALAMTRFAAWCYDQGDDQYWDAALACKLFASEQIPTVVEKAIQAHGGIGFTFEHDLHLYLRRAQTQAVLNLEPKELAQLLAGRVTAG